jgi:hypothetical protein
MGAEASQFQRMIDFLVNGRRVAKERIVKCNNFDQRQLFQASHIFFIQNDVKNFPIFLYSIRTILFSLQLRVRIERFKIVNLNIFQDYFVLKYTLCFLQSGIIVFMDAHHYHP